MLHIARIIFIIGILIGVATSLIYDHIACTTAIASAILMYFLTTSTIQIHQRGRRIILMYGFLFGIGCTALVDIVLLFIPTHLSNHQ